MMKLNPDHLMLPHTPKLFHWPLISAGTHVVGVSRTRAEAMETLEAFRIFKKGLRLDKGRGKGQGYEYDMLQQGLRTFETDVEVRPSGNFFHVLVISKARRGKGQIVK